MTDIWLSSFFWPDDRFQTYVIGCDTGKYSVYLFLSNSNGRTFTHAEEKTLSLFLQHFFSMPCMYSEKILSRNTVSTTTLPCIIYVFLNIFNTSNNSKVSFKYDLNEINELIINSRDGLGQFSGRVLAWPIPNKFNLIDIRFIP